MTQLNLTRPMAFIDLETTGVNVGSDRIVEICILKIMPDGERVVKTHRVNPTIPIPKEASEVHGIKDVDVKDCPTFKDLANELAAFIDNSDIAGYNSNRFDVPLLAEEFLRAEIDFDVKKRKLVDVQNIFHKMEERTLKGAYKFYCGKEIVNHHSAEADILATYEVLLAQLEKYKDVEHTDRYGKKTIPVKNDVNALHDFTKQQEHADLAGRIVFNKKGQEVFNFGKHKDKPVDEVFRSEPSYYNWMMQGDFPLYTKKVITDIRLRTFGGK